MSIGQKIIDEIIKQELFDVRPQEYADDPHVIVWDQDAAKKLSALVACILKKDNT